MAKKEEDIFNEKENKLKALQAAMSKIEKDYGKGSIMKLGDEKIEQVEVIPTGSISLNVALGVGGGFSVMLLAGMLSGILGIGSGVLKVIAMDGIMKVPFKVSTTTSNFMMGVTACASAVVYIQRGNIVPGIACPVLIGVLFRSIGTWLLSPKLYHFTKSFV